MGSFAHGYGLVIGVGEYSDPQWNVPIAERDARDLHAALTDPAVGGYPTTQVELLCGVGASGAATIQALGRLAARSGPEDTVFIAITSHGALNERDLYTLATSDAQFIDGKLIRVGTGLNIRDLANALRQIRAERLLLVINACFAGYTSALASRGGLREEPAGTVIPNSGGDALLTSGKGRALITASRSDQRSYFHPDEPHSAFGQALIDGLRGVGVSPRSGYIGLFELYGRIYAQVSKLSASRGDRQDPVLSLIDGVGPFPVALHSGADGGEESQIQQEPPAATAVRTIQIQVADNRKVIDFGSAQIGSVTFRGDVAQGDIIKTYHGGQPDDDGGDAQLDTLKELPKLQQRVAIARNVDEFARNTAAFHLSQATLALTQGKTAMAVQFIDQALPLLDAMNNGYINSAARKLRAVREALV
ncbi:caspase family protein [Oscillochloris sp. ZM17-4]|uniref:caspase family protein n=1 Tax=Oscillochloris sp. ZM17-4 TaxID=2866714 RepID=UPI001C732F94|nr:caspase family protein [Oscillochloris sp. ZM17-4]MBX0330610.1 caspase family protein [Oscillochloris sp. ZM17-4]